VEEKGNGGKLLFGAEKTHHISTASKEYQNKMREKTSNP